MKKRLIEKPCPKRVVAKSRQTVGAVKKCVATTSSSKKCFTSRAYHRAQYRALRTGVGKDVAKEQGRIAFRAAALEWEREYGGRDID